jgi:hypothetical protein
MKKLLIVVLVVLVVLAGSVLWVVRSMGVSDAALLLPAETTALASLPDLPRAFLRWRQTTLAKIGAEPQMKAFLEQPLQFLTKQKGGDEATGILFGLKPGRIFAAAVPTADQETAAVIGFQYWGGKPAHDAAVARLRQEIAANTGGTVPEERHETYEGIDITSTTQGSLTIYNASHGRWGFISNNLTALKGVLDRAAGRLKEGSLAESSRYKQVLGRLPKEPDFLIYLQPQPVFDALLAAGQALGAQQIPEQVDQVRKVEAVGLATKLEGANIRDAIFVLRPNPPEAGRLTHEAIKLTTKNTTAFFDFVLDFAQLTQAGKAAPLPAALQNSRILELLPQAFGPDCAASLTLPENALIPQGVLALTVKDSAKAAETLQEMVGLFPETSVSELSGQKYYSFPALQTALVTPTVTLTDKYLLIGRDAGEIESIRQAAGSGDTLENAPAFVPARDAYRSANEVFAYIDTRVVFERSFPYVRQILPFTVQVVPGLREVIDPAKIPDTETIARHLSPIVFSQSRLSDGYLVESTGPFTLQQAALIGAAVGASFSNPLGR